MRSKRLPEELKTSYIPFNSSIRWSDVREVNDTPCIDTSIDFVWSRLWCHCFDHRLDVFRRGNKGRSGTRFINRLNLADVVTGFGNGRHSSSQTFHEIFSGVVGRRYEIDIRRTKLVR